MDYNEARDDGVVVASFVIICTSLQTDTMPVLHHLFLEAGCPSCHRTNNVKALKEYIQPVHKKYTLHNPNILADQKCEFDTNTCKITSAASF